jgi:pyruvate ferredoxin oxidoreductase delta subunit
MPKGTGWKDIPLGGLIVEAGNAIEYKTGGWRAFRPVRDVPRCTNCMFCWVYCPDSSILVKDEKMTGFDLDHCKGCGICAKICPTKCIEMVEENAFIKEAK